MPPYLNMPNTIRPPLLPTPKDTTLVKQQPLKHASNSNSNNNVPKKKINGKKFDFESFLNLSINEFFFKLF